MDGQAQIAAMMERFRQSPPASLQGIAVTTLHDYEKRESRDLASGAITPITLPKSNVLQFILADGSKISARPSGTEPKIKFYFSVRGVLGPGDDPHAQEKALDEKIKAIISELNL
jgi:phosphoglucomutase